MRTLCDDFSNLVCAIGMTELKHPIFYNSPIGIRFEIGGAEGVYLDDEHLEKLIANPAIFCSIFMILEVLI